MVLIANVYCAYPMGQALLMYAGIKVSQHPSDADRVLPSFYNGEKKKNRC